MAATVTITNPATGPAEAINAFTIAITGLANNNTAYNAVVTDPSGATALLPFTSTGGGASPTLTYVPQALGTLTVNVQLAKVPASEGSATATVSATN